MNQCKHDYANSDYYTACDNCGNNRLEIATETGQKKNDLYIESWELAVQMMAPLRFMNTNIMLSELETWQVYFYKQLNQGYSRIAEKGGMDGK